jgi:hypothetical protein
VHPLPWDATPEHAANSLETLRLKAEARYRVGFAHGVYGTLACAAVLYVLRFACLAILNTPLPNP